MEGPASRPVEVDVPPEPAVSVTRQLPRETIPLDEPYAEPVLLEKLAIAMLLVPFVPTDWPTITLPDLTVVCPLS